MKTLIKDNLDAIITGLLIGLLALSIFFMVRAYNNMNETLDQVNSNLNEYKLQLESTEMEYHEMTTETKKLLEVLGVGEMEPIAYSEEEVRLLAQVIDAEARNQPYLGKLAVGAVVINRVKSEYFGNSIAEVILSPGQFAKPGQALPESIKAAKHALAGLDPTKGAIYFYNPSTAECQWIQTRPIQVKIKDHVFAR